MLFALFISGIVLYLVGSRLDKRERAKRLREFEVKYGRR